MELDTFQKTVLAIAVILLIICLVLEAVLLSNQVGTQTWPPLTASCPDYWTDIHGTGLVCVNQMNKNQTITWSTAPSDCDKFQASTTTLGYLPWDGINYGAPSPCTGMPPSTNTATFAGTTSLLKIENE